MHIAVSLKSNLLFSLMLIPTLAANFANAQRVPSQLQFQPIPQRIVRHFGNAGRIYGRRIPISFRTPITEHGQRKLVGYYWDNQRMGTVQLFYVGEVNGRPNFLGLWHEGPISRGGIIRISFSANLNSFEAIYDVTGTLRPGASANIQTYRPLFASNRRREWYGPVNSGSNGRRRFIYSGLGVLRSLIRLDRDRNWNSRMAVFLVTLLREAPHLESVPRRTELLTTLPRIINLAGRGNLREAERLLRALQARFSPNETTIRDVH